MSARVHTLANGVRVVADPMPGLSSLALSVVVRGGARWEAADENGYAHLLEHMVFKGAGDRGAQAIAEVIEAEGGQINAATGFERTSYQVRCLKQGMPLALEVLSDLVLHPWLDPEELEREKQVIGQEIADAADTPDDRIFDLAQSAAFGEQALGRPILGTDASLRTADQARLAAFHRRLYAPDRIVVAAAGAVDEDALLTATEHLFGAALPQPELAPEAASLIGGTRCEVRKLEQAQLVWLCEGVGLSDPDYEAQRVFAEILGGGMASRLFQEVREKRGLAYAVDAYAAAYEDVGVLGVYAGCAAKDARQAAALIVETLADLADQATEMELQRAKAQGRAGLHFARESALGRAEQAAAQLLVFGRLISIAESEARLADVSLADLRRVGARALAGRQSAAILGTKSASAAVKAFQRA